MHLTELPHRQVDRAYRSDLAAPLEARTSGSGQKRTSSISVRPKKDPSLALHSDGYQRLTALAVLISVDACPCWRGNVGKGTADKTTNALVVSCNGTRSMGLLSTPPRFQ